MSSILIFFSEMFLVHQNQIAEFICVFAYLRVQYMTGGYIPVCVPFLPNVLPSITALVTHVFYF